MSHFIEDTQVAIELPALEQHYQGHPILLIAEGGDNNVSEFVERGFRSYEVRARDWNAVAFGARWEVMTRIVERAADCEGGMLVLSGQRRTLPEAYIRRWRSVVNAPATLADLERAGITITAKLTVDTSGLTSQHQQQVLADLVQTMRKETCWQGERPTITFDLRVPEQVEGLRTSYGVATSLWGEHAHFRVFTVKGSRGAVVRREKAVA